MELYSALLSDAGWSAKDTVKIKAPHGSEYIRLPEKWDSEPTELLIRRWLAYSSCLDCYSVGFSIAALRFNCVEATL